MDRKKALFRAKLNEKKEKSRINSPLVRYNELDQPVCRVCDVVLKSESLWDAHQVSRKHHQAVSELKSRGSVAGKSQQSNVGVLTQSSKPPRFDSGVKLDNTDAAVKQVKGGLPEGFFDNTKEADSRTGGGARKDRHAVEVAEKPMPVVKQAKGVLPEGFFDNKRADSGVDVEKDGNTRELAEKLTEVKQAKRALPAGFFDNKEDDLRARGIKIVKPDVKDEYKEFEKLIQEDLQEVDNRMEEDEIDAAEVIEEYEMLEQKASMEKVNILKKKRMELEAARLAKRQKSSEVAAAQVKPAPADSSSDEDDDDGNFALDWRAQHL